MVGEWTHRWITKPPPCLNFQPPESRTLFTFFKLKKPKHFFANQNKSNPKPKLKIIKNWDPAIFGQIAKFDFWFFLIFSFGAGTGNGWILDFKTTCFHWFYKLICQWLLFKMRLRERMHFHWFSQGFVRVPGALSSHPGVKGEIYWFSLVFFIRYFTCDFFLKCESLHFSNVLGDFRNNRAWGALK